MIFIGGVGPRRKKIESHPRICSNCGLSQAYLVRMDDYLSLFFIPIVRIRKGQPFVECERCGHITDENGKIYAPGAELRIVAQNVRPDSTSADEESCSEKEKITA